MRPELLGGTDAHIYSLHKITVDSLQVVCNDTTLTIILIVSQLNFIVRARITGFPKINGSGSPRNLTQTDRAGAHGNYRVGVESRALVETPCGHRTIGELQESDQVMTLDHGFQKILWINKFFFLKAKPS